MIPWLVAYASSLISKFTIDVGGKTPHERCRGRKFTKALPEFGECVLYLKGSPKDTAGMEARWENGVFLGVK